MNKLLATLVVTMVGCTNESPADSQGLEGTPRVQQYAYDGYDRRVSHTDPMGNVTTRQ